MGSLDQKDPGTIERHVDSAYEEMAPVKQYVDLGYKVLGTMQQQNHLGTKGRVLFNCNVT